MPLSAARCVDRYPPTWLNRPHVLQTTIRASRIALGAVLVVVGVVLALPLVPGPGLVLVFIGLTVLGNEFEWARRWRDRLRQAFHRATGRPHGDR
jgi:uncharacterized protein (TIGR02611 family)